MTSERYCPFCGVELKSPTATTCWLCHQSFAEGIKPLQPRRFRGDNPAWMVFGVLAILIGLGMAIEVPGALAVLVALAMPAFIRTIRAGQWARAEGAAPDSMNVVGVFFSSLGIISIIGLASFAAFYATCFAACLGGLALGGGNRGGESMLLVASVGAGLVPGLFVAYKLFRRLWPQRS
ncbi:MAG: hypothetical protein ACJ8C4_05385 [Gemmataceae bacterium]